MLNRYEVYNETLHYIEKRRTSWQFICYSPRSAASSRSYGKDTAKLQNLYEQGYEDAKRQFADLKAFLQNKY